MFLFDIFNYRLTDNVVHKDSRMRNILCVSEDIVEKGGNSFRVGRLMPPSNKLISTPPLTLSGPRFLAAKQPLRTTLEV